MGRAGDSLAADAPIHEFRGGIYYSPKPLAATGELAFVYPGSGNQFARMGGDLMAAFPGVLDLQAEINSTLGGQYAFDEMFSDDISGVSARDLIFAQVAVGTFTSDLLGVFGLAPSAAIGYSLGESASLFGLRFWRTRDEMFRRIHESTLFTHDLSGEGTAARAAWKLPSSEDVEYVAAIVPASAERVSASLGRFTQAYLLIINSANESVVGGRRGDVLGLCRDLGVDPLIVTGVTIAHCSATAPVERPYRELHTLPVTPRHGCRVYSGARAQAYSVTSESAAEAITAAVLGTIDFRATVERAYADGVRMFVEVGPGASCSRIIGDILGDRPHFARSICVARQDNRSNLLRTLAALFAEGVDVDWSPLIVPACVRPKEATMMVPSGRMRHLPDSDAQRYEEESAMRNEECGWQDLPLSPTQYTESLSGTVEAHGRYLSLAQSRHRLMSILFQRQSQLIGSGYHPATSHAAPEVFMNYDACLRFANGRIGDVLGEAYAEIDGFPHPRSPAGRALPTRR